ncbi:MAG: hypothetical protein CMF67_00045 [Magnetovibrio sp.]|nr:hypothetical protein [Magnetovibrio sp.]
MENILGGAIWIGFAFLLFWVVGKFKVKEGGRVDRFTEKLSLVFLFLGVLTSMDCAVVSRESEIRYV